MVLNPIKLFADWRERRFLRKHGCETRAQYERKYDPDVFHRATRIKDYYHGYPYVYCFENHQHDVYHWDVHIDGIYMLEQWIASQGMGKHRFDWHRVYRQTPIGLDGPEEPEWWINELGGGDYIFVAFKEPKDFTWFLLRWT